MSEARTRGRCPDCHLWVPPVGLAESAGSSGERRVAGALSRERAVSWSLTPVERRAGLRRTEGRGGRASGGLWPRPRGGTGVRCRDCCAQRWYGWACRGEGNQQLGAALLSAARTTSLPARSPAGHILAALFHRLGNGDPEKGRGLLRVTFRVWARANCTQHWGGRLLLPSIHFLTRAGETESNTNLGGSTCGQHPFSSQNLTLQLSSGKTVPTSNKQSWRLKFWLPKSV